MVRWLTVSIVSFSQNRTTTIIGHGLSQCDTDDAPVFSKVWQQLEEKIADVFFSDLQTIDDIHYQIATIPFVAHNARFDEGCLKAVFRVYQMDYPDYRFYDTLAAARRQFGHSLPNHQLHTVAAACGYDLIRCPIISSTLLQPPVVTTFRIIIMPWPMPKPVLP